MNVELKHTLTVDAKAWYIRFYIWLYEDKLDQITFCKLFWAYVFAPIVLVIRGVRDGVWSIRGSVNTYKERPREKKSFELPDSLKTPKPVRPKRKPAPWQMAFLHAAETTGSKIVMAFQTAGHILHPLWALTKSQLFGRILLALGTLIGVGICVGVAGVIIAFWSVTQYIVYTLLTMTAIAALIYLLLRKGFVWIGNNLKKTVPFWRWLDRSLVNLGYYLRIDKFGRGVEKTGVGFFTAMKIGYVAVKSNTCPRIEVSGVPTNASLTEERIKQT
jgi:hypothetical protein